MKVNRKVPVEVKRCKTHKFVPMTMVVEVEGRETPYRQVVRRCIHCWKVKPL